MSKHPRLFAVLAALAIAACGDATITAPDDDRSLERGASSDAARAASPIVADHTPAVRWNELARTLVADNRIDPPMASRYYALLGVAQYAAARKAIDAGGRSDHDRPSRDALLGAVSAASAEVLAAEFPNDMPRIRAVEQADAAPFTVRGAQPKFFFAGREMGRLAAAKVLSDAKSDGADGQWRGTVPVGDGFYAGATPARPYWSTVRPWFLRSSDQFRPPPPPSFGSAEFLAAVAEVRRISDTRTPEQLAIATFWADGAGTMTPPGHWNRIAGELVEKYGLGDVEAAQVFALLGMTLMDAGIACWEAKYAYWFLRPWQADPLITTPIGKPNHPSYPSGHATYSGAAAEVLGALFPAERESVRAMAEESAMSRLYGGIHYRFDNDQGLVLGRKVGALALASWQSQTVARR